MDMTLVLIIAVVVLGVTQVLTAVLNHDERKRMLNAVLAKHAPEFAHLERVEALKDKTDQGRAADPAPRRPMGI